jgi:alpha-ketoglutarate-dependent taurine dioxygenase
MLKQFIILLNLLSSYSLKITQHPLESKIAYIHGLKDVNRLDRIMISDLKGLFNKYPLLIFKEIDQISPNNFINFLTNFDDDYDKDALENPDKYPNQMLQPFDQFPDCKHVAPRGNVELNNFYNINNIKIKPSDTFINNYLWHTDLLGHEYKLPNVITGFYIVENPLIGGDTDFISGERVYQTLTPELKEACHNMIIEINRNKFISKYKVIDYSGSVRLETFEESSEGKTFIPLVFAPDNINETPRILLLPSFFERVVGWSVDESRKWIKEFMHQHVLPHRVSIQWRKGDLAVFNNRRFMHSSTPARNYLDFPESSKRLLLQTFLPTKRPLLGIKPIDHNMDSLSKVNWSSKTPSNEYLKFVIMTSLFNSKYNGTVNDKYYVLNYNSNNTRKNIYTIL